MRNVDSLTFEPSAEGTWSERYPTLAGLAHLLGYLCCPWVLLLYGVRKLGGKYEEVRLQDGGWGIKPKNVDYPYRLASDIYDSFDDYSAPDGPAVACIIVTLVWLMSALATVAMVAR